MNRFVIVVVAACLLGSWLMPAVWAGTPEDGGTVAVEVRGVRSEAGSVVVALYGSIDGFPSRFEKALRKLSVKIRDGKANVRFEGVAPGRYAVCAVHDENGNGRLDTNILGIPREGVGVSNNVRNRFGPPGFEDAAFSHGTGPTLLEIRLHYL